MTQRSRGGQALLIGINSYPLIPGSSLYGCENDVRLMQALLCERFGFREPDIEVLLSAQATRMNILGALDRLCERVATDEPLVLFYAGHGSRIPAQQADALSGWHETLVPHDSGRDIFDNLDIVDLELRDWLNRATRKTRYVTLLMDCCHSATLHRDPFAATERGVVRKGARHPASLALQTVPSPSRPKVSPSWLPSSDRYVVMAACRDSETAREHPVRSGAAVTRYGALTYFLSRQIQKQRGALSCRQIFESAHLELTAVYPAQHPVCEGSLDRVLFGITDLSPTRYILITASQDDVVTLNAGQAQGMLVGSEWDIYQPADAPIDKDESPCARVAIISSGVLQSQARRLQPGREIVRHSRAIESSRPIAAQWPLRLAALPRRLHDNIEAQQLLAELTAGIERSPLLRTADAAEPAAACIYVLPKRQQCEADEGVPQRPVLSTLACGVVRPDGGLLMDVMAAAQSSAICKNLERLARREMVRGLTNEASALGQCIEFWLLRNDASGQWTRAHQHPDQEIAFAEGERLAIELTNRTAGALYINILFLDANGAIYGVYPPENGQDTLGAGGPSCIGKQPGDNLRLFFPGDLCVTLDDEGQPVQEVTDHMKLFVTKQPLDSRALLQSALIPGHRSMPAGERSARRRNQLLELLRSALTGSPGTRSTAVTMQPEDEWLALTRTIRLKRAAHGAVS